MLFNPADGDRDGLIEEEGEADPDGDGDKDALLDADDDGEADFDGELLGLGEELTLELGESERL